MDTQDAALQGQIDDNTADIATNAAGVAASVKYTDVIDEDDMASNSDTKVPTQQSVKAFIDAMTTESNSAYGSVANTSIDAFSAVRFGSLLVINVQGTANSSWGDSSLALFTVNYAALGCSADGTNAYFVGAADGGNSVFEGYIDQNGIVRTVDSTLGRSGATGIVSGNGWAATIVNTVNPL